MKGEIRLQGVSKAYRFARGEAVTAQNGVQARLRTVAPVSPTTEATDPPVPEDGPPYVSEADLAG